MIKKINMDEVYIDIYFARPVYLQNKSNPNQAKYLNSIGNHTNNF